jgi:hypothetical protein
MIRLASSPEPHFGKPERTAFEMFKVQNGVAHSKRNMPEQGPMQGPSPKLNAAKSEQPCDISPADWDALFNAVTERLEACSGPAPLDEIPELAAEHDIGRIQNTVRECVDSMNRLHAALPRDWHQRKQYE